MMKPTAAVGHMPFPGSRTCEHMFKRPLVAREFHPAYVERAPRNRYNETIDCLGDDEFGDALNRAQKP